MFPTPFVFVTKKSRTHAAGAFLTWLAAKLARAGARKFLHHLHCTVRVEVCGRALSQALNRKAHPALFDFLPTNRTYSSPVTVCLEPYPMPARSLDRHGTVTVDAFRVGIQDYVTCLELLPTVLEDEAVAKAFFKTELGILLLRVKWELFARYW